MFFVVKPQSSRNNAVRIAKCMHAAFVACCLSSLLFRRLRSRRVCLCHVPHIGGPRACADFASNLTTHLLTRALLCSRQQGASDRTKLSPYDEVKETDSEIAATSISTPTKNAEKPLAADTFELRLAWRPNAGHAASHFEVVDASAIPALETARGAYRSQALCLDLKVCTLSCWCVRSQT